MVVMLCSCPPAEAPAIARALVEERLVACVNIVSGVTSVYRWEGAVHEDAESTLLIKTSGQRVYATSERLRELHSYDTPEIVVLPVDTERSDPRYLAWVEAMTR